MDRLSRLYREKKEGDLRITISPPVGIIVRREDEGTSHKHIINRTTPHHKDDGNTCEDCKTKRDTEWILELSLHPPSNTHTIPALVNALPPTSRMDEVTSRPFHLETEATPDESDAPTMTLDLATTERGSEEQISPRTREKEGANRERGRSRTAYVFLDSGCLTAILEKRLHEDLQIPALIFLHHI